MIVTEYFKTREDGVILDRTYSDAGFMIRQTATGAVYDEAIDPRSEGRQYDETDVPIETAADYFKQFEEREQRQDESIEMLTGCLLEMSETVYS